MSNLKDAEWTIKLDPDGTLNIDKIIALTLFDIRRELKDVNARLVRSESANKKLANNLNLIRRKLVPLKKVKL